MAWGRIECVFHIAAISVGWREPGLNAVSFTLHSLACGGRVRSICAHGFAWLRGALILPCVFYGSICYAKTDCNIPASRPRFVCPRPIPWHFPDFLACAEQGDLDAEVNVGTAYHQGLSPVTDDPSVVPKDDVKAVMWWRRALEHEDGAPASRAAAAESLGEAYHNGSGVHKDDVEAVKLWSMAADCSMTARFALASAYHEGQGVQKDDRHAVELWRAMADHGFPMAQMALGNAYWSGAGAPRDLVVAYMWYTLAIQSGLPGQRERELLARSMSPRQIAEGAGLASQWKPVSDRPNEQ